ncbi:MAG: putative Fe-S oxidoreductase [Acidobacteria bacterium]|nr:putative Fe-S oxidoreductase [Acidobacteriota bacterium]
MSMHRPIKYLEKVLAVAAGTTFNVIQFFNKYGANSSFTPRWSGKPLQKTWEKSKPPLGWPRTTDSLCPRCVIEAREKILTGEMDYHVLIQQKVGEIKATILERDGEIWMVKECTKHGKFEDIMSTDVKFMEHLERNFPGYDIQAHNDDGLHNHGSSSCKYGRGAVLTIDLTNRCNMMCNPCFMDANQVGFVHELSWEEIKRILDTAITVKPRRQMSVQFSGGEPTLSPYFYDAIAYARKVGYGSVQAATNGIVFAQDAGLAKRAYEAGLRYVYLQFDGIGNDANSHRKISNLFDVKLRAINNLHEAGVEIVLVTTLINTINNDQVGPIIQFAMDNPKKISFVSFQPVSFTGRDEEISDERRFRERYTLSQMAHDVKKQLGISEPTRDWFPISLMCTFSDFADLVHGEHAEWGNLSCGCHPDCGAGTAFMINKATKEKAMVPAFMNVPKLVADIQKINDAARGKGFSNFMAALALLKNFNSFGAPESLKLMDILKKFDKTMNATGRSYGKGLERRNDPWNFLFVAGMWFQDLFNYDFRRTEMCIIPYGTEKGEIPFCAYNTGIGWRNIVEKIHMSATVADWHKQHGRHTVYANNKPIQLDSYAHSLVVDPVAAARKRQDAGDGRNDAGMERMMQELPVHTETKEAEKDEDLVQISQ